MKNLGVYNIKTKYISDRCRLSKDTYTAGGRTALVLIGAESNAPLAICTVNLPEVELAEGEVIIKSWSENEGLMEELERHGIISPVKRWEPTGFVQASVHDLLV